MEGMDKIDLGKMSDMKLKKVYDSFYMMKDAPKYKDNPAVGPLTQKLRDEMVKRGLRNNETDENKCHSKENSMDNATPAWSISQKKFVDCSESYAAAMEDVAQDLRKLGSDKAKIQKYMQDHNADFVLKNSKENSMDKLTAMKKKILLSNASDTVKAKALKKVMSNAELPTEQRLLPLVKEAEKIRDEVAQKLARAAAAVKSTKLDTDWGENGLKTFIKQCESLGKALTFWS